MRTTIYLATARGLSVITGADGNWRGAVQLKGKQIQCVAADFNRKGVVYCGTFGDGVFRSDDGGATWKASHGVTKPKVMTLAGSNSGAAYAGTEPSAIFRSDDSGETWRELGTLLTLSSAKEWSFPPRPETHHVRSILPDLAKPSRLHVAIEAGALLRSDDAGGTWRDRVPSGPKDTHSLAVHPHDPTRLHSAAGDGYFESVDDGDSWRRIVDGLEHQYCWSIAVSIADPSTLLLSASKSAYAAHFKESANSFVYRRAGNEAWRQVPDGLPKPQGLRIPVVAASSVEPGLFYSSAEGMVWRSADDGLQWQKLAIQWIDDAAVEHAVDMAIVEEG
jgi:photosystem II stability/assembly factor-like uncharacterized protein